MDFLYRPVLSLTTRGITSWACFTMVIITFHMLNLECARLEIQIYSARYNV